MRYNKHRLFIEKVNAQSIAKKIDTPFYCYSFNKKPFPQPTSRTLEPAFNL